MEHIAIMKKSWGLIEKILTGEKTIESRWYKLKYAPWDKIEPGETIYFKDSGEPVTVKAKVKKVLQFDGLNSAKRERILSKYGGADLGAKSIMPKIRKYTLDKNYCILAFFDNVERVRPFEIDKKGYGTMSAWIATDDVEKLKK